MKHKTHIFLAVFLILCCFPCETLHAGNLRASCIKINTTPDSPQWLAGYGMRETPSIGVHDSLYMKIVCLDDGTNRFFLISSDLCKFPLSYYETFCEALLGETTVTPDQVMWSVTHTHSGPGVGGERNMEYSDFLRDAAIDGIKRAESNLVPAKLGYISSIALANINRRAQYPERTWLGKNPNGPVDRQLGIIKIEKADGSPIALIVNYAMHGTTMFAGNLLISGDAPGIVASYVEECFGAPMLYINGACGDLDPLYAYRDEFEENNHFNIDYFKTILGDPILVAENMVTTDSNITLKTGKTTLEIPYNERRAEQYGPNFDLDLSFLTINGLMIYNAPLELFCEIAMDIRDNSPFAETFYFGYTNGGAGYLPTQREFARGGYEIDVTPFDDRAEKIFYDGVTEYIDSLHK